MLFQPLSKEAGFISAFIHLLDPDPHEGWPPRMRINANSVHWLQCFGSGSGSRSLKMISMTTTTMTMTTITLTMTMTMTMGRGRGLNAA